MIFLHMHAVYYIQQTAATLIFVYIITLLYPYIYIILSPSFLFSSTYYISTFFIVFNFLKQQV
ncbi:MAG: hypothetical protein EXX96DRAFT_568115 [Benjaminiella poitrasii]|nr:MAG: hypothetical protein EXX96DRAFT_568115 [Benjaminiella poitrasii]